MDDDIFSGRNLSTKPKFQFERAKASVVSLDPLACAPTVTIVAKSLVNSVFILKSLTKLPSS